MRRRRHRNPLRLLLHHDAVCLLRLSRYVESPFESAASASSAIPAGMDMHTLLLSDCFNSPNHAIPIAFCNDSISVENRGSFPSFYFRRLSDQSAQNQVVNFQRLRRVRPGRRGRPRHTLSTVGDPVLYRTKQSVGSWKTYVSFRSWRATNSGSVSSSLAASHSCRSDLRSGDSDRNRTPRWPVFSQQISASARNWSLRSGRAN